MELISLMDFLNNFEAPMWVWYAIFLIIVFK